MPFWGHLRAAAADLWSSLPFAAHKTEGGRLSDPATAAGLGLPGQQPNGRIAVTEQTALNISAVWAAVRSISGSVGILPQKVYRRGPYGGRQDDTTTPGATLAQVPNDEMTAITFWETLVSHALVWGNGYAEIERDQALRPIGLWPVMPNRVRPMRDADGKLVYSATTPEGQKATLPARDVFHLPGLGFDGLRGYSVVSMARRSLGINATAEQAGETFFAEGMRPSGYLEFPGSLQDLQKMNVEESIGKKHTGASRFGKNLILYGGMKYTPLGIEPRDAQFLETRRFQTVEVARWFNIPPHLLRDLDRATFSNIEQQSQEYVTHTLLYWLTKITQEFDRKVLKADPAVYSEHLLDTLLRGDTLSRYTAYGIGRQWGWLSSNDVLRKENMPPRPGGDDYLNPVNMAVNGAPPKGSGEAVGRSLVFAAANLVANTQALALEHAAADPRGFLGWIDREFGATGASHYSALMMCALPEAPDLRPLLSARREELLDLAGRVQPSELAAAAAQVAERWRRDGSKIAESVLRGPSA
jgi:HK97 family phage portal protein